MVDRQDRTGTREAGIEEYANRIQFLDTSVPEMLSDIMRMGDWTSFLDVGCGDGSLLNALSKNGFFRGKTVFAIDLSETRIAVVKESNAGLRCFVNDACHMVDIPDCSIDVLASTQVIEHVPSDEDMVLEMRRVLKSGGHAYLSTVFKTKHGWYRYRFNGRWVLDPTHVREYTVDDQLIGILNRHGLHVLNGRKSQIYYPVIDAIMRRIGSERNVFRGRFLRLLRRIRVPIPGYYNWEIICTKAESCP